MDTAPNMTSRTYSKKKELIGSVGYQGRKQPMDSSADLNLRELLNQTKLQNVNLEGSFSDSFSPTRA